MPTVLPFSEEFCLFYSSSFNLIYGDTESGKTWLCLAAVASVLSDGGTATIIDLDHNGAPALIGNLIKLGVDPEILQDPRRFRLSEPGDRLDLVEVVQDQAVAKPDVVILDSLGEILPLFRANSNSADDFTAVHAEIIKPLTRNGASVLVVDHLAKNADSRSYGPTGTAAKLKGHRRSRCPCRVLKDDWRRRGLAARQSYRCRKIATAACVATTRAIPSR